MTLAYLPAASFADGSVARVGSETFATLEAAINAADEGATVALTANVTISSPISISKSVVLTADDPGYEISAGGSSVFNVTSAGTLTLSGNTTLAGSASGAVVTVSGGTFNMRTGAEIVSGVSSGIGAINASSGRVNLMGGSIVGSGNCLVNVGAGASLRMSGDVSFGGAVSVALSDGNRIEIPAPLTGSGTISILPANTDADTEIAFLSGGTELGAEQIARFAIEGTQSRSVYLSGTSLYITGGGSDPAVTEAKYNGNEYPTVAEAVAAIPAGGSGTVELVADAVISETLNISGKNVTLISNGNHTLGRSSANRNEYMIDIAKGASLSLGTSGGTLTVSGKGVPATMPVFNAAGTLTVGSHSVIRDHNNVNPNVFYQGVAFIPENGKMSLSGGTLTGNTTNDGTVNVYGGTFSMTGGSINGNNAQYGAGVYVYAGSFSMSGGTIYGNTATAAGGAVWCGSSFTLSGGASILSDASHRSDVYLPNGKTINFAPDWKPTASGSYSATVNVFPQNTARDTKVAVVTSGNATPAHAQMFTLYGVLAENNSLRPKDNYIYIGAPGSAEDTVYVGDQSFPSLTQAFAAVPANGVATEVVVVGDTVMGEAAIVSAGQNIILRDGRDPVKNEDYSVRTVTRSPYFEGTMILVSEGGSLKLTSTDAGKLVLSGAGVISSDPLIFTTGALIMEKNVTLSGNVARKNEALRAQAPVFGTGGAVLVGQKGAFTMNGGSIRENYAAQGGAVCVMNGRFTMNGGSLVANSSIFGGAVCVLNTVTADNRAVLDFNTEEKKENTDTQTAQTEQAAQTAAPAASAEAGVFEMNGGEITSNKATAQSVLTGVSGVGGGVCIGNGAIFRMKGGAIKENAAEKGKSVCVGLTRPEKDEGKTVPVFELYGAATFGTDCDIYLTLKNDSRIIIKEPLTGIKKEAPLVVSVCDDREQNTVICTYAQDGKNISENRAAAKNMCKDGAIVMSGVQKELYSVDSAAGSNADLVNTVGESMACFKAVREYDGLPKYEEPKSEPEKDDGAVADNAEKKDETAKSETEKAPEEKKEIEYKHFAISPKDVFTASYEMSYHSELYKSMQTLIVGAFPVGTAITMIDSSGDKPVAYYYTVTGKENASDYAEKLLAEKAIADEKNEEVTAAFDAKLITEQKSPLQYIEIDTAAFVRMGSKDVHYKVPAAKKTDDGKVLPVTEKMTFVVDFANCTPGEKEVFLGDYIFMWSHRYPNADGTGGDISYNFGRVEYTVTENGGAEIRLSVDEDGGIVVSYALSASSRICIEGGGIAVLTMKNGFPDGSYIVCKDVPYPVSVSGNTVSIPLPTDTSGEGLLRGRLELRYENYLGEGVPGHSINAKLYASGDGRFPIYKTRPDAESENITLQIPAKDVYAIRISDENGRKPIYDTKTLKEAQSISFKLEAMKNSTSFEKVIFHAEKHVSDEYVTVPLSHLFAGFDEAGEGAVAIAPGEVPLTFSSNVKAGGGTYRLVFTAGDKTEYIGLSF